MGLGDILSNYTYLFVLIFVRYVGLFMIAPIFASRVIPVRIRVALAFMIALITIPVMQEVNLVFPESDIIILIQVLKELSVGLIIGFIAYLSFAVVQLAGRFIDVRMGFAIVNTLDPIHGQNMPLMGQYKNIMAILLFLAINGHHILIKTLYHSFEIIPLSNLKMTASGLELILRNTGNIFILAFKIALPVIGAIFIADVILGFMAKTIPQMNIFVVGLPLKILIGFLMLFLSVGITLGYFNNLFDNMFKEIIKILRLLH